MTSTTKLSMQSEMTFGNFNLLFNKLFLSIFFK